MTSAVTERPDGVRRGRGGRPTREEAARRDARLVEAATRLFMERGFEGTSMDAVAEAAGVSKPTLYGRYRDKRALFTAVLRERVAAWLAPLSAAAEAQARRAGPADVEGVLHDLSRALLAEATLPGAEALKRCIVAQAMDFPEIARLAHEEGWLRGVRAVAALLAGFADRGQIVLEDPEIAADLFLNLVLGRQSRLALYGIRTDPETQERRRQAAVRLFLNGVRVR
ncbi:transcriptional regulator, TetR family [Methylobacterium sp. 4-46]|uniref:TetR/AcrR family transcriptional regulator n=1 Tax=unclassified Methylobacterium TaxID=2615210 RepID=UPI000165CB88|nr:MULTISPECIES: TetR/AcrR family transcriptional regulator [Methylobacterium]ACA20848.1 transcriptional regulator, TetR family [Methylobacterium sp. 4-46]WFT80003.1 TetR/AcrR family transcriptional regulator [Methylobacterium nodulans]